MTQPDPDNLLELARRAQSAASDDQEDVLREAWKLANPALPSTDDRWFDWYQDCAQFEAMRECGAFESAALMLVPEGWRPYSADMSIEGRTRWMLEGPKARWEDDEDGYLVAGSDWYLSASAATPALALAAAALRARSSNDQGSRT